VNDIACARASPSTLGARVTVLGVFFLNYLAVWRVKSGCRDAKLLLSSSGCVHVFGSMHFSVLGRVSESQV
jgi:hypothetical protein